MKITLSEDGPERLWPECRMWLQAVPATATYHEQWDQRPPLGIYNVSLENLPRRFGAVLDDLQELSSMAPRMGPTFLRLSANLLDSHQALLYAVREHFEDCVRLSEVLFPKTPETLKDRNLKAIKDTIASYSDVFERLVNAFKHRQARMRLFEARNSLVVIPGYTVVRQIEPGLLGPDPDIFKGKGGPQAFSFANDLRRSFVTIYVVGAHLATLLKRTFLTNGVLASQDIKSVTTVGELCPWAFEIADKISKLSAFVFPNELRMPIPVVSASCHGTSQLKRIGLELSSYPTSRPLTFGQIPGGNFTMTALLQGDGVSPSMKVP